MNHTTIGDIVRGDREVFPPYLYEVYQSTQRRAPGLPRDAAVVYRFDIVLQGTDETAFFNV